MIASFPVLTAAEAASMIRHGETVGFSGFTPAGAPKAIPLALADCANLEHAASREFQIGVLTGASTGPSLDGALAKAGAIRFRTPIRPTTTCATASIRGRPPSAICTSMMPQVLTASPSELGEIEACYVTAGGGIVLTSAVGTASTFCNHADKILIELNRRNPPTLLGIHDIYEPADPPNRRQIPIYSPSDRIGSPIIPVPPS